MLRSSPEKIDEAGRRAVDCQKHDPSDKNMCGTQDASHIGQLGCANRICGESGSFPRNKHSAAVFHNPNQDVRTKMHGDTFEYLMRVSLSNPKTL